MIHLFNMGLILTFAGASKGWVNNTQTILHPIAASLFSVFYGYFFGNIIELCKPNRIVKGINNGLVLNERKDKFREKSNELSKIQIKMDKLIQPILEKALARQRLNFDDGLSLFRSFDLISIGNAADQVRQRLHPNGYVTYIVDRNINYTNLCYVDCDFCAFYRQINLF